jgi:hypothetical protein
LFIRLDSLSGFDRDVLEIEIATAPAALRSTLPHRSPRRGLCDTVARRYTSGILDAQGGNPAMTRVSADSANFTSTSAINA